MESGLCSVVVQLLSQQFVVMALEVSGRAFRQVWFCCNQHGSIWSLDLPTTAGSPQCLLTATSHHMKNTVRDTHVLICLSLVHEAFMLV